MAEHTPGPWDWIAQGDDFGVYDKDETLLIASVPCRMAGDQEAHETADYANAHLIAAAPDMLAALEAIQHWWGHNTLPETLGGDEMPPEIFDAMNAAIAKARGEG